MPFHHDDTCLQCVWTKVVFWFRAKTNVMFDVLFATRKRNGTGLPSGSFALPLSRKTNQKMHLTDMLFLLADQNGKHHLLVDWVWFVICICVSDHISGLLEHVLGAHMGGVNQINLAHYITSRQTSIPGVQLKAATEFSPGLSCFKLAAVNKMSRRAGK